MNVAVFLTVLVIGVAAILVVSWHLEQRGQATDAQKREKGWLPTELRDGTLLMSEPKPLFYDGDVSLVAKPDRAYRKADGQIKLVELKTRDRHAVYDADLIELSVQKVVVEGNRLGRVEDEAFVVTQLRSTGERRLHRVRLMSAEQTTVLARRYLGIKQGAIESAQTTVIGKCRRCGHVARCRPDLN